MDVEREVDRLIDERPGPELLVPAYDDPAYPIEGRQTWTAPGS